MRYRVFSERARSLLPSRLPNQARFWRGFRIRVFLSDKATTFVTRSYGAMDKIFPNEKGPHRYRLQGLYHTENKEGTTQLHLTWDKLSHTRMVGDFRSDDFEINTEKRSRFLLSHQVDRCFLNLSPARGSTVSRVSTNSFPLFSRDPPLCPRQFWHLNEQLRQCRLFGLRMGKRPQEPVSYVRLTQLYKSRACRDTK